MLVFNEINLENFEAWSGGKDRLQKAKDYGMVEELSFHIEITYGTEFTATQLNDILWFEVDEFFEEIEEF